MMLIRNCFRILLAYDDLAYVIFVFAILASPSFVAYLLAHVLQTCSIVFIRLYVGGVLEVLLFQLFCLHLVYEYAVIYV